MIEFPTKTIFLTCLLLIFMLLTATINNAALGASIMISSNTLRVALGLDQPSAEFTVAQGTYELVDYITQQVVSPALPNSNWLVVPAASARIQITNNGQAVGLSSNLLLLRQKNPGEQNIFRYKSKNYRGDLLIENVSGKFHIINLIDAEQYLYGVVGPEMGTGAKEEAYKAQAIVSRSYALYYKEHPQLFYDVGISTAWQVYTGYDGEIQGGAAAKKAVDDTKGLVIYYDNKVIQAFFHANSGGYTESCENVWFMSLPYIQPVPAPEDAIATQVAQYNGWPANSYQWEKTFTLQELAESLKKWNAANPDEAVKIGAIKGIEVSRQAINPQTREYLTTETLSRRATKLAVIGENGSQSFYKDGIRSLLNLKSTLIELTVDSAISIRNAFGSVDTIQDASDTLGITVDGATGKLNGNNGNYYIITAEGITEKPKTFTQVTISGKGHGHGLGMSQWGARGMAENGAAYRQIIEHYYNQDRNNGVLQIRAYVPAA